MLTDLVTADENDEASFKGTKIIYKNQFYCEKLFLYVRGKMISVIHLGIM